MPEHEMVTSRRVHWRSCNCDYLCPCIYTNPQEAATRTIIANCGVMVRSASMKRHFDVETKLDGA